MPGAIANRSTEMLFDALYCRRYHAYEASLIAEKYQQRDAQTSGDLIAAEGYLQHAEHYNRLFAAAQEAPR